MRSFNTLICCELLSLSNIRKNVHVIISRIFIIFIKLMSILIIILHNHITAELEIFLIMSSSSSLLIKDLFKCLLKLCIRNVIIWRFEHKSKHKRNVLSLSFDNFVKLDESLVHDESFLHFLKSQCLLVSVKYFCDQDVINVVNFDQIEEQHVHKVLKQSCFLTKVFVLKHLNDHSMEVIEMFLNAEQVFRFQFLDVTGYVRTSLGQKTRFRHKFDQSL